MFYNLTYNKYLLFKFYKFKIIFIYLIKKIYFNFINRKQNLKLN